jgi:hypothetical protein
MLLRDLPPEAVRAQAAIRARPDGQLAIAPPDFGVLVDEMCGPRDRRARERLAVALLAVAVKSERLAPHNTRLAVAQLGVLIAVLLRDIVTCERAMIAAGLDRRAIAEASSAATKLRAQMYGKPNASHGVTLSEEGPAFG